LPLAVVDGLARLPEKVGLRVVGYETVGSAGYITTLLTRARELGVEDRIEILGVLATRADVLDQCRRADIGLALTPVVTDDFSMQTMAGASNKAFDYMACGLPLVVSDLPDWRNLYVDSGYAFGCRPDDPVSIECAVRRLIDDPVIMRAMGERGRQRIEHEWNYEMQFAKVREHLLA
jgi:glycosyltransferase involved in cell wall biosynthesis